MTINEIMCDIHALEADLENYERKYGLLSETFYEAYRAGEEPADCLGAKLFGLERLGRGLWNLAATPRPKSNRHLIRLDYCYS